MGGSISGSGLRRGSVCGGVEVGDVLGGAVCGVWKWEMS